MTDTLTLRRESYKEEEWEKDIAEVAELEDEDEEDSTGQVLQLGT